MHRLVLAIRVFFQTLFHAEMAQQVARILTDASVVSASASAAEPAATAPATPAVKPAVPRPSPRNDALTLLATLQREARFLDFMQESLASYSDAQIGAAVRDVHRDTARVLERLFAFHPVVAEGEGAEVSVSGDIERYEIVGNVTGQPPFRGKLMHHGWEAERCELPTWNGTAAAALVVAPAEVEVS
jgi:hypothetical protein